MITLTQNQTATLVNLLARNGVAQSTLANHLGLTDSAVFKLCCMAAVQERAECLVEGLGAAVAALPTEHQRLLYSLERSDEMVFRLAVRLAGKVKSTELRKACSAVRTMDRKNGMTYLKDAVAAATSARK